MNIAIRVGNQKYLRQLSMVLDAKGALWSKLLNTLVNRVLLWREDDGFMRIIAF